MTSHLQLGALEHSFAAKCTAFRTARRSRSRICVSAMRASHENHQNGFSRRVALSSLLGLAATIVTVEQAHADPFLSSTGARGILVEEEQRLYNLRKEKETEARQQLLQKRDVLEKEARDSQIGRLCATPFGVDVVGITEFVGLVGALVGGITARQRKAELERLNEQLRKINMSLRQQARAGTVYAPGLTYAPPLPETKIILPPTPTASAEPSAAATSVAVAVAPPVAKPTPSNPMLASLEDDELTPDQLQCKEALRAGKRFLKQANGSAAMVRFEKALMLSKALADRVLERRAVRGLAAAARLQGQFRTAINNLVRVLEISKEMQEFTGDADAYGTIADCYTDLGEFEKAAMYYDKYIERMNKDGPV